MTFHEHPWSSMTFQDLSWPSMKFYDHLWYDLCHSMTMSDIMTLYWFFGLSAWRHPWIIIFVISMFPESGDPCCMSIIKPWSKVRTYKTRAQINCNFSLKSKAWPYRLQVKLILFLNPFHHQLKWPFTKQDLKYLLDAEFSINKL